MQWSILYLIENTSVLIVFMNNMISPAYDRSFFSEPKLDKLTVMVAQFTEWFGIKFIKKRLMEISQSQYYRCGRQRNPAKAPKNSESHNYICCVFPGES